MWDDVFMGKMRIVGGLGVDGMDGYGNRKDLLSMGRPRKDEM